MGIGKPLKRQASLPKASEDRWLSTAEGALSRRTP
jgi:hypothetical protein